jgi:catechol 2,3-dioxygenase-like lactoylglutathione lyase family enzyme
VITGAHTILYSTDAEADRRFLADVLGFRSVDAGGGWLIFALPPAEVAVHPTDGPSSCELYFLCDDIEATVADLRARGATLVDDGAVSDQGWGRLATVVLPGGGQVGVYEPRHASPLDGVAPNTGR